MRKVLGVAAGLVLAWLLAIVLKFFSDYLFAPAALDPSDPEQARQIMSLMPAAGLVSVLLIFFVATLAGAFTAARVAHVRWAAWAAGGLMLLVTAVRAVMGHYPAWLIVATLAVIAVAAWLGGTMAGDGDPDEDLEEDGDDLIQPAWSAPEPAQPSGWPEEGFADPEPADAYGEPSPEAEPDRPRWTPLPPRAED